MPKTPKSQIERQNNWIRDNKEVMRFLVPKGHKAVIEAHFKSKGYKSLNAYINSLIQADMERTDPSK